MRVDGLDFAQPALLGPVAAAVLGEPSIDLEAVAAFLRLSRGVEIDSYRTTTVRRRLAARMQRVGARDVPSYLHLLHSDLGEVDELLRYIRINVTRFTRNASSFRVLGERVLPALEERGGPIRVWSAGCSTGEEAYSLLMLLAETVAPDIEVSLTATDVDERALHRARTGSAKYPVDATEEMQPEWVDRYLDRLAGAAAHYQPNARLAGLAARVEWVHHDLLSAVAPAPGSFDLIVCRNVLIYLSPVEQRRVQAFLADCLAPGGTLFLGEAEALSPVIAGRFEVIDQASRLYRLRDAR